MARELIDKLLFNKDIFSITIIDNLSSPSSSREFSYMYEYLDEFTYIYGDIVTLSLTKYITSDTIIIYNIWSEPSSIMGLYNVVNFCKDNSYYKFIYTTKQSLKSQFISITSVLRASVCITCEGELIGNYGIENLKDPIDTIQYYKDIGNNVYMNRNFNYYDMTSAVNFIYLWFFIHIDDEHTHINQPLKVYT
jgi:hypothetical protein|tara:strand:- start:49 stop:627 length:579 start_codon:yes stop_codon:yes gene_type:complete